MKNTMLSRYLAYDRYAPLDVPANYGFIDGVTAPDGDYADIFVITDKVVLPAGVRIDYNKVKILGAFECIDNEVRDDKIVAVLADEPLDKVNVEREIEAIKEYLSRYKKGFEVLGWLRNYDL